MLTSNPSHHRDAAGEMGLAVLMLLAGLLLWPVGLIGTLFGMVVISATSGQREFLADAYAVQFTRNPEGLAGALKVLAGGDAGSHVRTANALEASGFFFARMPLVYGLDVHASTADGRILRLIPTGTGYRCLRMTSSTT